MRRFGIDCSWRNMMAVWLVTLVLAACSTSQAATKSVSTPTADVHLETEGAHDESGPQDEAMHGHDDAMSQEDMAAMHDIPAEAAARANPIAADAASIGRGAELYQTTCAICHGPEGKGDGPAAAGLDPKPANLTEDHVQSNTDGALFYTISNGVAGTAMVAWSQQYSEEDRWHLVNFLRTLAER